MLALSLIVAVAFAVEAAAGFGSTLLVLGLGGLFLPLPYLLSVVVPANLALSAWILARDFRACQARLLIDRLVPLMAVGVALGAALTWLIPVSGFAPLYAVLVIVLALIELSRSGSPPASPSAMRRWLFAAGIVHGLFAASGPLVVMALSRTPLDKRAFRATLAALWLLLNAVFVATQVAHGAIGLSELRTSAQLLVPLAVGLAVGSRLHHLLSLERFRQLVFGTLLAGGVAMLTVGH